MEISQALTVNESFLGKAKGERIQPGENSPVSFRSVLSMIWGKKSGSDSETLRPRGEVWSVALVHTALPPLTSGPVSRHVEHAQAPGLPPILGKEPRIGFGRC